MLGCLNSGISGLNANNNNMSVIANNIANVNTPGYKAQRATFADVLSQQSGGLAIGNGVDIKGVSSMQGQGALDSTDNATDVAIDGNGLFIVKNAEGSAFYTRAGQFQFNVDGKLATPDGHVVQGWDLQDNETITGLPTDIDISNTSLPPKATTTLALNICLDSNASIIGAGPDVFDINDPHNTSNYSTSVSVFDSLGHNITFYFSKLTAPGEWEWNAVLDEDETQTKQAWGTIAFTEKGFLDTESATTYRTGLLTGFNFNNGSEEEQAINIDFGTSITTDGGTGADSTTQYADQFATRNTSQDGYPSGSLNTISVNREGVIQGSFTNGHIDDLAIIALADFNNPAGLRKTGNNLYMACNESGQAIINPPASGGMGKISSYSLEGSNVDLASEFMKMIITQRAFQANARSITVADQMLTEIVSLKR
jgi:flagellar hook protein FlgE